MSASIARGVVLPFLVSGAVLACASEPRGSAGAALAGDSPATDTDDAIRAFIEYAYYGDADVQHSFTSVRGQQIDCIDFFAQHSVKALRAQGIAVDPTMAPSGRPQPVTAATAPDAFAGDLDSSGRKRECPAGTVPSTRPTVAAIRKVGGIDVFKNKLRNRRPPAGSQSSFEHDCWLNTTNGNEPGTGTYPYEYEHAVGINNVAAYGLLTDLSVYGGSNGQVPVGHDEHNDSQFWVQTGSCDNLYPNPGGSSACTTGAGGNAIQSLEGGWIVAPEDPYFGASGGGLAQDPFLFFFTTSDAYYQDACWAGQGGNCCQPSSGGGLTQGSDCWVAWPGASYVANQELTPSILGQVPPQEVLLQVWQGYPSQTAGWWVWVNGNLVGWYPPNTFTYPGTSVIGPMGYGAGSYIQAGGEVFNTWTTGGHTSSAMGSGVAPSVTGAVTNYGYAAYQRNIMYIDGSSNYHPAGLTYYYAPSYEDDYSVAGLCGYSSGYWTNGDGMGAYSLSVTGAPVGYDWGNYLFFGGGEGQCARGAAPPCSPP